MSRCVAANASVGSSGGAVGDAAIVALRSFVEAPPMFWNHCFCLWLKCCCSVAAFSVVCRVVPCVLYAVLLRVPQCSGIKPSACCLLLLLGDAPGKAELRYHVKSQGSSAELL